MVDARWQWIQQGNASNWSYGEGIRAIWKGRCSYIQHRTLVDSFENIIWVNTLVPLFSFNICQLFWSKSKVCIQHTLLYTTFEWDILYFVLLKAGLFLKTCRKGYYQEGNYVYDEMDGIEAYKRALTTWAKWIDSTVNFTSSLVFFRSYSPSHFRWINFYITVSLFKITIRSR